MDTITFVSACILSDLCDFGIDINEFADRIADRLEKVFQEAEIDITTDHHTSGLPTQWTVWSIDGDDDSSTFGEEVQCFEGTTEHDCVLAIASYVLDKMVDEAEAAIG